MAVGDAGADVLPDGALVGAVDGLDEPPVVVGVPPGPELGALVVGDPDGVGVGVELCGWRGPTRCGGWTVPVLGTRSSAMTAAAAIVTPAPPATAPRTRAWSRSDSVRRRR